VRGAGGDDKGPPLVRYWGVIVFSSFGYHGDWNVQFFSLKFEK